MLVVLPRIDASRVLSLFLSDEKSIPSTDLVLASDLDRFQVSYTRNAGSCVS